MSTNAVPNVVPDAPKNPEATAEMTAPAVQKVEGLQKQFADPEVFAAVQDAVNTRSAGVRVSNVATAARQDPAVLDAIRQRMLERRATA